jgi:hypothetical protein
MATTPNTPTSHVSVTGKKRVFDFESLTKKSIEFQAKYTPVADDAAAIATFGTLTEAERIALVNDALEIRAVKEAKAAIKGWNAKVVFQIIAGLRMVPKYQIMGPGGKVDRKAQAAKILADIRGNEFMWQNLQEAAAVATDDDDEDESTDE